MNSHGKISKSNEKIEQPVDSLVMAKFAFPGSLLNA